MCVLLYYLNFGNKESDRESLPWSFTDRGRVSRSELTAPDRYEPTACQQH